MVDVSELKRSLPPYSVATVEDLKKSNASELPIRKKSEHFQFPLNIQDKIDVALVMEKFRKQKFYSGLAAPQLGILKRLIVFTIPRSETNDLCRTKVFLNPTYEKVGDDMIDDIECCASVRNVVASVPRYARIRYQAFDIKGGAIEGEVTGTTAQLIQHEVDHLDGKLFIDLVSPDKLMSVKGYIRFLENKNFQTESSN